MKKEKEKKEPDYPKKEKGYFMDEQKFSKFSNSIFQITIIGYLFGLYLNIIFIDCCRKKIGLISTFLKLFLNIIVMQIIIRKICKHEEAK